MISIYDDCNIFDKYIKYFWPLYQMIYFSFMIQWDYKNYYIDSELIFKYRSFFILIIKVIFMFDNNKW